MQSLIKPILLILPVIFSVSLHAEGYNITINIDGAEVYSEESEYNENITLRSSSKPKASPAYQPRSRGSHAFNSDKTKYTELIARAADRHQVDPKLLHAVIQAESAYNATAISSAGAMGLMQLMPATARRYGVTDRSDPDQNIDGGTRYLKHLLQIFDSNLDLAVAAYNAGENAVIRNNNAIPPYPETQNYVKEVLSLKEYMNKNSGVFIYGASSKNN